MRIVIVGCGTLGEAVLGGLIASGTFAAKHLAATVRRAEHRDQLAAAYPDCEFSLDSAAAVAAADVVLVAVKPQRALTLLPTLATALTGKLVISVCAGLRLEQLRAMLPGSSLIRAMPNTPCLIREGMTVVSPDAGVAGHQVDLARSIFAAVGRCSVLEEKHLDVVTGLSGSGPAFVFVVLEALADGGVMMGLPRDAALELAAQTMQGAARLALESGEHPAALKDGVTTPAGCTIAGLLTLEDGRIRSTLARAIQEATRVASELGGG